MESNEQSALTNNTEIDWDTGNSLTADWGEGSRGLSEKSEGIKVKDPTNFINTDKGKVISRGNGVGAEEGKGNKWKQKNTTLGVNTIQYTDDVW